MKRWRMRYASMTASYNLGYVYAETKEEAERECRAKQTAFSKGELSLIRAIEDN